MGVESVLKSAIFSNMSQCSLRETIKFSLSQDNWMIKVHQTEKTTEID